MLYKVNMATVEQGSVSFVPSAANVVLDPPIVLELFIFKPIFYLSICVIFLAALKASLNAVLSVFVKSVPSSPTLYYKESAFSRFLLRKVPRFTESYQTPRWCVNPDIQYLTTMFFGDPKTDKIKFNRQYYQLKDRGLVALDWALPATSFCNANYCVWSNLKKSKTLLLILPDFNKTALSLGTVCAEALSRGFRPVVFHRRGHGGCPLTTPKLQAYGDPTDLRQTVKYINSCSPTSKLTALGYGIGADLLLAYLGEFGTSSFISACVAISPIYDPELLWGQGLRQPYSLVTNLAYKKLIGTHSRALRGTADLNRILKASRMDEAERILHTKTPITSLLPTPNEGAEKTQSFWERNAPLRDADDIETPLLCVSSRDDPFLTSVSIPYEIFRVYPNLVLALTEFGGHGAFLHDPSDDSKKNDVDDYSWPWRLSSWADLLALNFMQATLEFSALEAKCAHKHRRY